MYAVFKPHILAALTRTCYTIYTTLRNLHHCVSSAHIIKADFTVTHLYFVNFYKRSSETPVMHGIPPITAAKCWQVPNLLLVMCRFYDVS